MSPTIQLLLKMFFKRGQQDKLVLDFPSDYIKKIGWCQGVVAHKKDENGEVVACTLEGAIDEWGRSGRGRGQYVVPLKHEISRALHKPILTFWNDDPTTKRAAVLSVLEQAEDRILNTWYDPEE